MKKKAPKQLELAFKRTEFQTELLLKQSDQADGIVFSSATSLPRKKSTKTSNRNKPVD